MIPNTDMYEMWVAGSGSTFPAREDKDAYTDAFTEIGETFFLKFKPLSDTSNPI